jgi:hypothetical protein
LRFLTQETFEIGIKEIAGQELCIPGCGIDVDEGGTTLCAATDFFSGGLSKFRMAALRIALLAISSSAMEIPSADWILLRVLRRSFFLIEILRRSPSVEFNSDNEFSFVPEGDCNPGPSLILAGTSLLGLLEANGRGVINLDINRSPDSAGLTVCLEVGAEMLL